MAEISVIVPIYKAEKYLEKCVNSVLEQSSTDFELILVDDGSPDHSGEICDCFAAKDSRIKVIHKSNGGVSSARNAGLEVAQGEWVAFIDSDDYVSQKYLQELYKHVEPNALIMQGYTEIKTGDEKVFDFGNMVFETHNMEKVLSDFEIKAKCMPWGKLFKLPIIKENKILFNPQIHFSEDFVFMLEYLLHADRIVSVQGVNYFYRNDHSALSKCLNSFESEYSCFKEFFRLFNELAKKYQFKLPNETIQIISWQLMRSLCALYITNDTDTFFERIKKLRELKKEYGHFYKEHNTANAIVLRLMKQLFLTNIVLFDIFCVIKFKLLKRTLKK